MDVTVKYLVKFKLIGEVASVNRFKIWLIGHLRRRIGNQLLNVAKVFSVISPSCDSTLCDVHPAIELSRYHRPPACDLFYFISNRRLVSQQTTFTLEKIANIFVSNNFINNFLRITIKGQLFNTFQLYKYSNA